MGLAYPQPTSARQRIFSPSGGNASRIAVSRHTESRSGPRNCGQSSARNVAHDTHADAITAIGPILIVRTSVRWFSGIMTVLLLTNSQTATTAGVPALPPA